MGDSFRTYDIQVSRRRHCCGHGPFETQCFGPGEYLKGLQRLELKVLCTDRAKNSCHVHAKTGEQVDYQERVRRKQSSDIRPVHVFVVLLGPI